MNPEEKTFNIEEIKELMDNFDPATLLPELDGIVEKIEPAMRFAVMVGPAILLLLGVLYCFFAPREANHYFGYRCFYGMGSVEAWRFTQRLAGAVWGVMGLTLTIVMFVISKGFREMETMDMIWKAVKCVLWEIGLTAFSCIALNVTMMILFDHRGERRWRKRNRAKV